MALRVMSLRVATICAVLLAAAVAWGVLGHEADGLAGGRWLTSLGAPWLVVAFCAGLAAGKRHAVAAAAGAATLVVGVIAYYAFFVHTGSDLSYAGRMAVGWSLAAVAAGAGAGWAGAAARTGEVRAAIAPGAALLAEALLLGVEWQQRGARVALTLEAVAGAALLVVALRRRHAPRELAFALALIAVCLVAESGTRDVLRAAGWAGA